VTDSDRLARFGLEAVWPNRVSRKGQSTHKEKRNNTDCAILEYTSGNMCSWNGMCNRPTQYIMIHMIHFRVSSGCASSDS
jgi:hypothetical protein